MRVGEEVPSETADGTCGQTETIPLMMFVEPLHSYFKMLPHLIYEVIPGCLLADYAHTVHIHKE